METVPLLERVLGVLVLLLGVPVQHLLLEGDADGGTVVPEHALRVVKQVIGVQDADFDAVGSGHGTVVLLAANLGTDHASVLAVIEEAAQLIVSSLFRHELVEACLLDERRYTASVIARNGVTRVANKEGEVELLEQLLGHDRRVAGLRRGIIWERWVGGTGHRNARVCIGGVFHTAIGTVRLAIGADTALRDAQRRCNARLLLVWWQEVMCDVFDENTLALLAKVSFC